ncbi:MAG: NfeD family protein, partial [Oscillospiraceae bacterium]|nr:NfeD family protein [Oscillospiraceae bacterium]
LQFLAFAVSSAILLVLTKPLVKKFITSRAIPTNADRAIGETALVISEIAGGLAGQVKINGLTWTAVSAYEGVIAAGERVTVLAIEGVKLIVEPIKINSEVI